MISPRPLLDALHAQTVLDIDKNELAELLEEGLLYPAFNIGSAKSKRREVRLLSAGLTYYISLSRPLPADPAEVVSDLVPLDAPLNTTTFRRTLNCSSQLIVDLVNSKALALMPGEIMRRGRGGSAKLSRPSCIAWLTSRIL